MGDAGEGLVDAEARIQERLEELARDRARTAANDAHDLQVVRSVESLRLARIELERQLDSAAHERRRAAIVEALAELDRRMAAFLK